MRKSCAVAEWQRRRRRDRRETEYNKLWTDAKKENVIYFYFPSYFRWFTAFLLLSNLPVTIV